jgi:SAM-dependent methyltransferase
LRTKPRQRQIVLHPLSQPVNDPLGQALLDYWNGKQSARVLTWSDLEGYDYLPASYLFRSPEQMPALELMALDQCVGRVLELGAGAGSHAMALQKRGLPVTALDASPGAVEVMRKRGVRRVLCRDWVAYRGRSYDTVLSLMNGAGLAGDMAGLPLFLRRIWGWLKPGGQCLLDSADVLYLFTDQPGAQYFDLSKQYYGEAVYRMKYKTWRSQAFGWLFVDFERLAAAARHQGFQAECLYRDKEDAYLARLTKPR